MNEEFVGWLDDDWNIVLDQNQPIVRCRDCVHNYDNLCHEHECNYCGEPLRIEPDGFCAWGEPREGDAE